MVTLQTQYRMAGDIQSLANELVYCGRLQCGSQQQEEAMLALPLLTSSSQHSAWLRQVSVILGPMRNEPTPVELCGASVALVQQPDHCRGELQSSLHRAL